MQPSDGSYGHERLFYGLPTPSARPLRPLGPISDFVVEELPRWTVGPARGAAGELASRLARLCDAPRPRGLGERREPDLAVACLDLAMIQNLCDHLGVSMPSDLGALFSAIARDLGRQATFLYEDCVLANPSSRDPRLYLGGAPGRSERDFLVAHAWIEEHLRALSRRIREILTLASESQAMTGAPCSPRLFEIIRDTREPISRDLHAIHQVFVALRRMPPEHFARFRPYYSASPRTGLPGPSGRYSAQVHLMRLLVEGDGMIERVVPGYREELFSIRDFLPSKERYEIFEWLRSDDEPRRLSLREAAALPGTTGLALRGLLAQLRQAFDRMTAVHYGLAHRNLIAYSSPS